MSYGIEIMAQTEESNPFTTGDTELHRGKPIFLSSDEVRFPPDITWELDIERRIYRRKVVKMLHRYMRYSMDVGRLPSLVGREFFRSNVSKYIVVTFEDRVIFVHEWKPVSTAWMTSREKSSGGSCCRSTITKRLRISWVARG